MKKKISNNFKKLGKAKNSQLRREQKYMEIDETKIIDLN